MWRTYFVIVALLLGVLVFELSQLYSFQVSSAVSGSLVFPKMLVGALAAYLAVLGFLAAVLALAVVPGLLRALPARLAGAALVLGLLAAVLGVSGALSSAGFVQRVAAPQAGFAQAFGADWESRIPPELATRMLQQRWTWRVPDAPEPIWERDVVFWTIPGTGRQLRADIWQPPAGVPRSGLGFVYFHGAGWHYLDKDTGTRPMFRHLAAQGHVAMDVSYRLCPEADIRGQVADVKRALAWMKQNAARYGVNPDRIVAAGGSSGGNVALLATYAPNHPAWQADDIRSLDTYVRAVVSYYGPTDMRVYYEHAGAFMGLNDQIIEASHPVYDAINNLLGAALVSADPKFNAVRFPHRQMMVNLLGGSPAEVPEMYDLASPITHVTPMAPPTLLVYGSHDSTTSVQAARALYRKLEQKRVSVVYVEIPQTEHAFDIFFPEISPSAQAGQYALDHFLGLVAQ